MGAGFDKPANARYFALRFLRVLKIHNDRSFKETVSFEKLQEMVSRCKAKPEESEKEKTHWLERLQKSDYLIKRSRSSFSCNDSDHAFKKETGFGISGR
jgi:DNA ligase-4